MMERSHLHPITLFTRGALEYFRGLGFEVGSGDEIQSVYNNFDFLRMFEDHPARDVQDTFWTKDGRVLRTQMTSLQGPLMKGRKPPVRFIMPGRIYRHEATDATHEFSLHQMDGFAIDKYLTMGHLIGTLEGFVHYVFGKEMKVKFVPSYFPFVEPGMEMLMEWRGRWLEIAGAGMIHPGVLKNMGVDSNKWSGWAFGAGLDRLVMLYYGVDDIRQFQAGDFRFLSQF
jgi:phenylalanyl-tRNA synthetase alpha chain